MPTRPRPRAHALAGTPLALTLLAVALGTMLAACGGGSPHPSAANLAASPFDGAQLPGQPAPDFTLTDQYGRRVSLSEYRGRVVAVTFLYSTCGAPCVVIAEQIRGALDELPRPIPVLIVSADPQADTPARVRDFLKQVSLTGRAEYLTGPLARLRPLWRAYRVKPASAGRETFAAYASVLLLDREGRERVLFESEQLTPESLSHDIRKLDGDPTRP